MGLASELKKVACPRCSETGTLQEIVYGMPSVDFDFEKDIVGGCVISDESPNVGCSECGWRGIRDSYTGEMIEVFEPKGESKFKKFLRLIRVPFSVFNRVTKRFAGAIAIVALLLGGGGVYLGVGPYLNYNNTDPEFDGYVQPRGIQNLVNRVLESTLTITCDAGPKKFSQGSGWAIDLPIKEKKKFSSVAITNHHVIEDCLNESGQVRVKTYFGKDYLAQVDRWDKKNDLAVVMSNAKAAPLPLSQAIPYPGYWVMAAGTPNGYEGSVAFGSVLNGTDTEVLITAPISNGNSGGPLVDNEGNVIGTNAWSQTGEQYNGAISLDAMCIKIMKCDGKFYWSRD
jgi:serine protease Do